MKKRKKPDQSGPDFNNNPFTFLKKIKHSVETRQSRPTAPAPKARREEDDEGLFLRAMAGTSRLDDEAGEQKPQARQRANAAKGRDIEAEDENLFLNAMSGTRRLDKQKKSPSEPGKAPAAAEQQAESRDQNLFVEALRKMGANLRIDEPESDIAEEPRTSSSGRMRQLKKGALRISAELDLHGSLRDEALIKLKNFVTAAYTRGQKAVLVITGKGINSPDGPVLQGAVAAWLREQGKDMVAEFQHAPRDKGGSGAFVVFLRNPETR